MRFYGKYLLAWCMILVLPAFAAAAEGIRWRTDLAAAQREAAQTNRLVLVHFWATWCDSCLKMDKTVFSDARVGPAIERYFVPVKLDADQHRAVVQKYGVEGFPSDVIVTPSGQLMHKMLSPQPRTGLNYVDTLSKVANDIWSQTRPRQDASRAALGPTVGQVGTAFGPPAGPGYVGGDDTQQGRFGGVDPSASRYGQSFDPRTSGPQLGGHPPQGQAAMPSLGGQNNGHIGAFGNPALGGVNRQAPAVSRLPGNSPPLAFGGFSVVSMHEQKQWVLGNPAWGAIHRGHTFLFANQQEQQRFLKTPDRFAPVFSGIDTVLYVDNKQAVPGKVEFGLYYPSSVAAAGHAGSLYLFSTEQSRLTFEQNPIRYAEAIGQMQAAQRGGFPLR